MAMNAEEICAEIDGMYGNTNVDRATTKRELETIDDKIQMLLETMGDVNSDDAGAFDADADDEDEDEG